jgi:hypothetical protein
MMFHLQIGGKNRENPGCQGDTDDQERQKYPVCGYCGEKSDIGKVGRNPAIVAAFIRENKEYSRCAGGDSGN